MPGISFSTSALAVIDMQEDFCEPNGSLAVKDGRKVASTINELLALPFRVKIASRDYHPPDHCSFASQHHGEQPFTSTHTIRNPENPAKEAETQSTTLWPDHCVQGTQGCELIPELDISKIDHIVSKGEDRRLESYSAFGPPFRKPAVGMTELQRILQDNNIERVYVCGLAYDYCVKSTAIDSQKFGFETWVVLDATAAVDQREQGLAETRKELDAGGVQCLEASTLLKGAG